jgi:glycolate oxidase iron-sulfur subunit
LSKIFKNSGIKILSPDFDCCGLPFLSEGNMKRFEQAAKINIEKLNADYDYLVTDCASCESTLLSYGKYFDCNITPKKTLNWGDIIALKGLKFEFKKPVKVTFHKPCHLKSDAFFEKIISNCTNVEYVKMADYDECCGFAGSFALKNRGLSKEISKNKALNIQNTDADYVITSCPACILGLKQGLQLIKNKKTKVVSLLEFLAMAEKIN